MRRGEGARWVGGTIFSDERPSWAPRTPRGDPMACRETVMVGSAGRWVEPVLSAVLGKARDVAQCS